MPNDNFTAKCLQNAKLPVPNPNIYCQTPLKMPPERGIGQWKGGIGAFGRLGWRTGSRAKYKFKMSMRMLQKM